MEMSIEPLGNLQQDLNVTIAKAKLNFKKSPKDRITQAYIVTRLEYLEEQWRSFSDTHRTIVTDVDPDEYKQSSYYTDGVYDATQELYCDYKTELKECLGQLLEKTAIVGNASQTSAQAIVTPTVPAAMPQVRLPKITIPTFSGKYTEWTTFKDLFVSLIHNNPSLEKVQKLHYLKGLLSGEAEQLLRHIPVTDADYDHSWDLLNRRFNNKKYMSNCILKRMISQPVIGTESSKAIKDLLDVTCDCLNGLKNQGLDIDTWDFIVIYLISAKLDSESRKLWEAQISVSNDYPTLTQFKDFLEHRFRSLEFLSSKSVKPNFDRNYVHHVHHAATFACCFCSENHRLFSCKSFAAENVDTRRNFVQTNSLCYNCLVPGHSVFSCRQTTRCRICNKKHHTLLHPSVPKSTVHNVENASVNKTLVEDIPASLNDDSDNVVAFHSTAHTQVLLATALVKVEAQSGKILTFRSLLDQGSQASFITEAAVQALGLKKVPTKTVISGIGDQVDVVHSKSMVAFSIQSIHDPDFKIVINAHVLGKLTSVIPPNKVKVQMYPNLVHLKLADTQFHVPGKIDLLLGADVYSQILIDGLLKGPLGSPMAQNTKLGWVLSGKVDCETSDNAHNMCMNNNVVSLHTRIEDDNLLKKFWELESEPSAHLGKRLLTPEEQDCEKLYAETTTRDEDGRYIVKLPFRSADPLCKYGESQRVASKRLAYLEKKLNKNPQLKIQYSQVLEEYLTLGHMEMVPEEDKNKQDAVYLPHHAIVREDRTTSKVRVVFDASSSGTNGVSLNNDLMIGPTLQLDLRHIVMRWRRHPIVLIADIVKMYRQIKVTAEDSDYQRILWFTDNDIDHYRMLRVTFGTASAPYLAVKTLHQLAKDEGESFPMAAEIIAKDFYMDDLMTGCQTLSEARKIYEEMNGIMKKGCFELQKWASNCEKIIDQVEESKEIKEEPIEVGAAKEVNEVGKVLGLSWNKSKDEFEYTIKLPELNHPVTKRKVLSDISRLFDPLGWIAPSIIQGKIFIQKLWMAGLDWDQELPDHLKQEWINYRDNLSTLDKFNIPRWIHTSYEDSSVELHGFCDASKDAYAAVVYIRVIDNNEIIHVNLVTSKTKVSPIKVVSIPRLELCGATLLTKLLCEVAEVLEVPKNHIHAWTDSQVVLAWLSSHPSKWKTFIANRVSDILTATDRNQWSHVSSKDNPADCASRGIQPSKPSEIKLWKNGPSWLAEKTINYSPLKCSLETDLEERVMKNIVCTTTNVQEDGLLKRFSSFQKLLRVVSYCRRFIKITLARSKKQLSINLPAWITTEELQQSAEIFIKKTQEMYYCEELRCLSKNIQLEKKSKIRNLNPFMDKNGLLRVGSRLQEAQLTYDRKNPILIPYKSSLTDLLMEEAHKRTLHGGPQLMLSYLRSKYWIVNARRAVKAYVHKCVTCTRYSVNRSVNQLMGQLPTSRVTPSRPFQQSGVDYAGPISIRTSKGRGHRSTKGYICLFVCMSTRAIHLEAVSDLTSDGFIAAFKRFVARRGHCTDLWSDNGTNFVGASRDLATLISKEKSYVSADIANWLSTNGTQWHFIPPHAPNFGGLWEAGVKSTKHHLRRVIGTSTLTFEEITTVLAQIEGCLNSRPISQISDNLDEPFPLTPGHFLVGGPLVLPPDFNYESSNISTLKRWQYTQKMLQDFWRRWSQEYLAQFFHRYKWSCLVPEPKVGDVVLVKEDDLPPARWLYGVITEKHPGRDHLTRVVSLRCKGSIIKRPVSKLCILPIAN